MQTEEAWGQWTMNTIRAFLSESAEECLEDGKAVHAVEVTVEGLQYGVDYNLGEVVRVDLSTGESMDGVISEVVESWDSRGYKATPGITRI